MKKLLSNQNGFTLIELLAAITLLSIVIITFMAVFTNSFVFNNKNADTMKAMNFAREYQAAFKEDPDMRDAMEQFITNIRDGAPNALSRDTYRDAFGLNLTEDIQLVSSANCFGQYVMKIAIPDSPYMVYVYVNADYDVPTLDLDTCAPTTAVTEDTTYLYRLNVEVWDTGSVPLSQNEEETMISETYTYFQYNE